jgi:hypothetical protein
MRGRVRLISVVAMLTVVLVVSAVFASGVVNPSKFTLNTMNIMQPNSPGPTVFVDPSLIIKDYINNPGYQIGNKFYVNINVTEMTDLFTWQLNLTWNPKMLNFTKRVTYGDFLYRTTSPDKTSRTTPIAGGDNVTGYGWVAETILGNYAGITGAGRLVSMEFQVVGYGSSNLVISTSGLLPTTMLNSAGNAISFTATNGYFRNVLTGDTPTGSPANFDKRVDIQDIVNVKYHWYPGPPAGAGGYNIDVDVVNIGTIDIQDIVAVKANWGRTTP